MADFVLQELVCLTRLELAQHLKWPLPPQGSVSTNSTTGACTNSLKYWIIISRGAVFSNLFYAPEADIYKAIGGGDERNVFGEGFDVFVEVIAEVDLV